MCCFCPFWWLHKWCQTAYSQICSRVGLTNKTFTYCSDIPQWTNRVSNTFDRKVSLQFSNFYCLDPLVLSLRLHVRHLCFIKYLSPFYWALPQWVGQSINQQTIIDQLYRLLFIFKQKYQTFLCLCVIVVFLCMMHHVWVLYDLE